MKTSLVKTVERLMRPQGHTSSSQSWMQQLTPVSPTTCCQKELPKCASPAPSKQWKSYSVTAPQYSPVAMPISEHSVTANLSATIRDGQSTT
ncbi:unnamed protein product [Toxocara canis]|uniref:Uncharacterized protein n=1 Tax=Toxocara canis TaxID=6265 RepID=A0A183V996_TOXCA|nr:unnamed protein product [Toxocara canis]